MRNDTPYTILLVEDDLGQQIVLKEILGSHHKYHTSRGLAGALNVIRESDDVDVVILDLNLIDSGGIDTVRAFVAVSHYSLEIPVIVTSNMSYDDVAESAFSAGASEFIDKGWLTTDQGHEVLRMAVRHAIFRSKHAKQTRVAIDKIRHQTKTVLRTVMDMTTDLYVQAAQINNAIRPSNDSVPEDIEDMIEILKMSHDTAEYHDDQ